MEEGRTALEGDIPINPSGGLKSFGHPDRGERRAHDLRMRDAAPWRGCSARQVRDAELGLAHNVGGPGAVSCVVVLGRQDS